jgi:hypothetical protein
MAVRSGTARRVARWASVLLLGGVLLAPGVASAAPPDGLTPGHGQVTPLLDCVRVEGAGTFSAVLGYENSGTATEHLLGAENRISPAQYDGGQPTKFPSGTHHGVVTVRVTGSSASWTLDGTTVSFTASSPACPPSAALPADGNGTGPVIAALVAGTVGAIALQRRGRRRASTP